MAEKKTNNQPDKQDSPTSDSEAATPPAADQASPPADGGDSSVEASAPEAQGPQPSEGHAEPATDEGAAESTAVATAEGTPADAADASEPSALDMPDLETPAAGEDASPIDLLGDVELDVKIELGRTHVYIEDVLKLRKGSVVPLDKLAGDPVDIYVNGRLIARGEVLVLNDNFCVRVADLLSGSNVA